MTGHAHVLALELTLGLGLRGVWGRLSNEPVLNSSMRTAVARVCDCANVRGWRSPN